MRIGVWTVAVFGSLIVFPNDICWFIAIWLIWVMCRMLRGHNAWLPLVICLTIILTKQPGWTYPLFLFLIVGSVLAIGLQQKLAPRNLFVPIALLCAAFVCYSIFRWTDANCSREFPLDPDRPVVCLGDSLTAAGYPQELARMVGNPVRDFGRDGYTTMAAIKELLPEIEALKPLVVIVELGGHDFKDGHSRRQTRTNLSQIIERLQAVDSQVVLVEIPRGFISDPYAGLERELCGKFDLQLIPDSLIRRFIYFSPIIPPGSWLPEKWQLSADGLHPNKRGNVVFAQYVKSALTKLYGDEIASKPETD